MKTLILATHNKGKITELKTLLTPLNITIKSAHDISFPDVEETGTTFEENAILKAETISNILNMPTLADDSGLCVDALNGKPGVYTKRYGTWKKLLKEMSGVKVELRQAHFTCVLALSIPHTPTNIFKGTCHGFIAEKPQGEGGFGYDPVFKPKNHKVTFAEMSALQKNILSHRGKALKKFIAFIQTHDTK